MTYLAAMPADLLTALTSHVLVQLVENQEGQTYEMHILEVLDLQILPGFDARVPIPEPGKVLRLGAGRRIWRLMQELCAENSEAGALVAGV
jgi:hypothetical protein